MSTPRITQAAQLQELLIRQLETLNPPPLVTLNGAEIPANTRDGAVRIRPPDLTWIMWPQADHWAATWEIDVVAGPASNQAAAWARIDEIIAALEAGDLVNLAKAEAGEFIPRGATDGIPAYTITLNPLDND